MCVDVTFEVRCNPSDLNNVTHLLPIVTFRFKSRFTHQSASIAVFIGISAQSIHLITLHNSFCAP
nr:MAG TPA: hypothetical protein [Caudoviricetes sp.]